MIRQDFARIDPKRRNQVDYRKKQFATPAYQNLEYKHRLNFYVTPPTADITLEQFEQWAIDRLRGMFSPVLPKISADDRCIAQCWQSSKPAPSEIAPLPKQPRT